MTFELFCQSFPPGSWKWTSKDPASIGMQLDSAFRAFAATVNALPGNTTTPLSVVRSHADATANRWGYTWQLGHPVDPGHLWFQIDSPTSDAQVPQCDTQDYDSGRFGYASASSFSDDTTNGGYGSYSSSFVNNAAGLAYIDSTRAGATAIGAILLIARDTTPGKEFFCWALKTTGGNSELHRDCCHAIYKSPLAGGWSSFVVFPTTSKQPFAVVQVNGYAPNPNRFASIPHTFNQGIHPSGHQLRSGIDLRYSPNLLQSEGLFHAPPPLIQTPAPLYIGSTTTRGPSINFGKVTRPDGVMLQLGRRSRDNDLWLWVPAGTSHNQASPWSSPLGLSDWKECYALHFISPPQGGGLQGSGPQGGGPQGRLRLVANGADFIRNFPYASAVDVRQHPQQGPLLSGSGGGDGGDPGGGGGGSARPSSGLLWPRRT